MTTAAVRKLALNTLRIAPENARKTSASAASHDELKASIRAHGVMQNLSAYDGKDGFFYVYAGGRRLTALQDLVTEGAVEAEAKIGCVVKDAKDAAELSLVENVMRAAMHPADEFEAFAALIDQGRTEDEVAERFGVTVLHVRKRMKLAALAPQLLTFYRGGRINQEILMAFTLSDSHERQMEVWTQVEHQAHAYNFGHLPNVVKRLMNETRVSATSKLVRFVGLDRYIEAGGSITKDLFSSNDETFLDDVGLLNDLAAQRLEEVAAPLRQAWKWVEAVQEVSYKDTEAMGRVYPEANVLPIALQEEFETLAERINAFDEAEALTEAEETEWRGLEERYAEIEELAEPAYAPELMTLAGAFVSIDFHGQLKIEAGLVRRDDMPALEELSKARQAAAVVAHEAERFAAVQAKAETAATAKAGSDDADMDSVGSNGEDEPATATAPTAGLRFTAPRNYKPASSEDETEAGPAMSAALVADLRAIRHQVFQAHLASDFAVAFDLVLFSMCQSAFNLNRGYSRKPIDLAITPAMTHASADHRTGTVSERIIEALKANLRLEWMTLPEAERFLAMCELTAVEKQALFAFAAAHGAQQQLSTDSNAIPAIEIAGARMNVVVEENWRPTAANYFGRVKKDMLIETARETIDPQWAHDHSGGKKADLARALELAFGAEARQRVGIPLDAAARAATWLPVGMAFVGKPNVPIAVAEGAIATGNAVGNVDISVALPAFLMDGDADEAHPVDVYNDEGADPAFEHFAVAAE